jgi:hypothetical protein
VGLSWAKGIGLAYWGIWEIAERGDGVGASVSVGALLRDPGGRSPLLDNMEDR